MRSPPSRNRLAGWMAFSLSPASATATLMVEHGWKPVPSATL